MKVYVVTVTNSDEGVVGVHKYLMNAMIRGNEHSEGGKVWRELERTAVPTWQLGDDIWIEERELEE